MARRFATSRRKSRNACQRCRESTSQVLRKKDRTGAAAPCTSLSAHRTAELPVPTWTSLAQASSPLLESHCSMGATFPYGMANTQSGSWLSTKCWPGGFLGMTTPLERWWRLRYRRANTDRKSTRLNSSHSQISYAVFCLKKKKMKYHYHV